MKVLLVDPPQLFLEGNGSTRQVQPLGLAYVGAATAPIRFARVSEADKARIFAGNVSDILGV